MSAKSHTTLGYLLKGYPRLSETFIANEMLLLEKMGFKLHIFALRNPQESKVHASVEKIQAPVTYISDYPWQFFREFLTANVRLFWRKPRTYWSALRWAVKRSLQRRDSATFKRFVQAAYLVEMELGTVQIDHFHAHFANDPTTVAFFVNWLTGISFSFTGHAKDIYTQDEAFLQLKLRQARFAATCTQFNYEHLQGLATVGTPIHTIYHGTDLERFEANGRLPNTPQNTPPIILSVGRLVPKKGFPTLIEALHILKLRQVNFLCFIVGSGPQKEMLHNMIQERELKQQVDLLGNMTQAELLEYYRKADVMALACQVQEDGDRDGIPNVLVEAMAMGTPVVATNISGIPELIKHGETGLLVPSNNAEALADALQRTLEQYSQTIALAANGQTHVKEHFDMVSNAQQLGQIFQRILSSHEQKKGSRTQPISIVSPNSPEAPPLV